MADINNVQEIAKKLHEINFGKDGIIKIKDYESKYNNLDFEIKGDIHSKSIVGVCQKCEDNKCNTPDCKNADREKYKDYRLCNISHGSHTIDFINALKEADKSKMLDDYKNWSDTPVMFLMENPSLDYGIYKDFKCSNSKDYIKRPAKSWYWIHSNEFTELGYPNYFKQGYYGEMVFSVIKTFGFANAYLTNIVKCGMNKTISFDEDNNPIQLFLGTDKYRNECIENCFDLLKQEVEALREKQTKTPLVVFCFSKQVIYLLNEFIKKKEVKNIVPVLLPHPANHISNDYRKYILLSKIYEALHNDKDGIEDNIILKNLNQKPKIKEPIKWRDEMEETFVERLNCQTGDIKIFDRPVKKGKNFVKDKNIIIIKFHTEKSQFSDWKYLKKIEIKFYEDDIKKTIGYHIIDDLFWAWEENNKDEVYEINYYQKFIRFFTGFDFSSLNSIS